MQGTDTVTTEIKGLFSIYISYYFTRISGSNTVCWNRFYDHTPTAYNTTRSNSHTFQYDTPGSNKYIIFYYNGSSSSGKTIHAKSIRILLT